MAKSRVTAMLRATLAALVLAALGFTIAGPASASAPRRYYLALGDSLSQGMQPDIHGVTRNTDEGYADQLFARLRHRLPGLRLVKLGCGGETTHSMITGHGNDHNARILHCDRSGGSQLQAALRFLRAHHARGEVPVVTIDIGANDVDGCVSVPSSQLGSCLAKGEAQMKHDLPIILGRLRHASARGTALAGMTLYDPVLAFYFDSSSSAQTLWRASVPLVNSVNDIISGADRRAGFRTADVAGAFRTYDTTDMVPFDGGEIPLDVSRVCSWTWACTTPPSGPNIHANKNGYGVIAAAFDRILPRRG
jgi:lysophospholipase L1-like esterase